MKSQALRVSLAVGILTASLSFLPGCTLIRDNVTGVGAKFGTTTECVRTCDRAFLEALAAETRRSLQNLESCRRLPTSSQRDACVRAELARYKAAVEALYAQRTECVNNCHTQGSGSAG
jgi:hypothetical protein